VRNEEIECIRDFLNDHTNVHIEKTLVNINDTVKINKGALMEYEGRVIGIKSSTVKIILPSLGYLMVAEVEKTNIKVITDDGNEANRHHLEDALSRQ